MKGAIMNTMKKLISILLCLTFIMALFACNTAGNGTQSTPEETPIVTPGESTPIESTPAESTPSESIPGESTPEASTPGESTPAESTPAESTPAPFKPEVSTSVPEGIENEPILKYKTMPDAFTELTAETRSEIEEIVKQPVNWDKHYLGTYRGFIIFGTYDPDNPKYYRRGLVCFGYITELYGYKDGTLYAYRFLYDNGIIEFERNLYIGYIGLKKEIGELPDSGKEVPNDARAEIIKKYRWYQTNYFGEYNGYYIFGDGSDLDTTEALVYTGIQTFPVPGQDGVYIYSPEKGVLDLTTAYKQNLVDIEHKDVARAVFIGQIIYLTRYAFLIESLPA